MIPREIETERLRLRQFTEQDVKAMARLNGMPEVTQYMGHGVMDFDDTWRQIASVLGQWHMRGYGPYAVDDKASGKFVGRIGPYYPAGWPAFEVGWLIDPSFWGQGLATEGAKAAVDCVFQHMDLDRICAVIHPDNPKSIRVAEKLGESCLGETPIRGASALLYGITRKRWKVSRR